VNSLSIGIVANMYSQNSGSYFLPKIRLTPLDNVVNRVNLDFLIVLAFSVVKINLATKSRINKVAGSLVGKAADGVI
jgi:hypothetical protein